MSMKRYITILLLGAWNWGSWAFLLNFPFSVSEISAIGASQLSSLTSEVLILTLCSLLYVVSAKAKLFLDHMEGLCLYLCHNLSTLLSETDHTDHW